MALIKNRTKRENFLMVSKIFLQDENLSLIERGMLATMHSLPDDWDFTIRGMEKILPDGKSRIRTALDGLVEKGYVSKEQSKVDGGKFGKNIIEIYERPFLSEPLSGKRATDYPLSVKPLSDNWTQYNKKEYNFENRSNNPSINLSIK